MSVEELLAKASARPWEVTGGNNCPIYVNQVAGEKFGVAMMDGLLEQRRLDAELIVLAVNSFEEQRDLLKDMTAALDRARLLEAVLARARMALGGGK